MTGFGNKLSVVSLNNSTGYRMKYRDTWVTDENKVCTSYLDNSIPKWWVENLYKITV
jgi:hypothetical protein